MPIIQVLSSRLVQSVCIISLFMFSVSLPVIDASPNPSTANGTADDVAAASTPLPPISCGIVPFQQTINTPSAYDWPTFQHDSARTGQVLMPAPFTNHPLGTAHVRGAVVQSITTGGNQLYAEGTSLL